MGQLALTIGIVFVTYVIGNYVGYQSACRDIQNFFKDVEEEKRKNGKKG